MTAESQYGGTMNSIEILLFHLTTVKILKAARNTTPHTVTMAQQDAEQFAKHVRERVFMRAFQALAANRRVSYWRACS